MFARNHIIWLSIFLRVLRTNAGQGDAQHPLNVGFPSIDAASVLDAQDAYDYGIGIDLTGSYGTISISYSNGTKTNLAKIDGPKLYKAVFKKYSLEASQHLHPPYTNYPDQLRDWPRQRLREWNKAHGFPASEEVGAISGMTSDLVTTAELRLGHNITAAILATPNVIALYWEDVADAFEYSALQSLGWPSDLFEMYHETDGAVAGNGFGLCQDYKNNTSCRAEERRMPVEIVLSVMYTADCLCVEIAYVASASYARGYPMSPPTMDFTLGLDALHDNPSETYYWEAVRDTILRGMVVNMYKRQPEKVFVLGDQSRNEKFRAILEEALLQFIGKLPPIFDEDPVFRAAQGAAEMARRRRFMI